MSIHLRRSLTYMALLVGMSVIISCDGEKYECDSIVWKKTTGSVQKNDNLLTLNGAMQKTELWAPLISEKLRCKFDLQFDLGGDDSSVGLETWAPDEYSITFRGGSLRIVNGGRIVKMVPVTSYIGRRITVTLEAGDNRLFAAIDENTLLDKDNQYWKKKPLQPRLNADKGDKITLYSCSCETP